MTLIPCKRCQRPLSSKAYFCPSCDAKRGELVEPESLHQQNALAPPRFRFPPLLRAAHILALVFFVSVSLVLASQYMRAEYRTAQLSASTVEVATIDSGHLQPRQAVTSDSHIQHLEVDLLVTQQHIYLLHVMAVVALVMVLAVNIRMKSIFTSLPQAIQTESSRYIRLHRIWMWLTLCSQALILAFAAFYDKGYRWP